MKVEPALIDIPQDLVWDFIDLFSEVEPLVDIAHGEDDTGLWSDHLDGDVFILDHPPDCRSAGVDSLCCKSSLALSNVAVVDAVKRSFALALISFVMIRFLPFFSGM